MVEKLGAKIQSCGECCSDLESNETKLKSEDISIEEISRSHNTIEIINIKEVSSEIEVLSSSEIEVLGVETIQVKSRTTRLCPSFLKVYPALPIKDSNGTGRLILKNTFRIFSFFTLQFEIPGCQNHMPFIVLFLHHLPFF